MLRAAGFFLLCFCLINRAIWRASSASCPITPTVVFVGPCCGLLREEEHVAFDRRQMHTEASASHTDDTVLRTYKVLVCGRISARMIYYVCTFPKPTNKLFSPTRTTNIVLTRTCSTCCVTFPSQHARARPRQPKVTIIDSYNMSTTDRVRDA